jgi:UDP-xylose/UDP-N-acetylglucosamine transporter B4
MGLYTQALYTQYGQSTASEFLFYSHLLSLPLFIPFLPSILTSFRTLAASPPVQLSLGTASLAVPKHLLALALNALTQYACISGVNLLSASSSALTVTVVLNVRKLISLVLSVWLFGGGRKGLDGGVVLGAVWVFGGGGVYGWALGRAQGGEKGGEKQGGEKGDSARSGGARLGGGGEEGKGESVEDDEGGAQAVGNNPDDGAGVGKGRKEL